MHESPVLELEHAHKQYESPGEVIHAIRDVSLAVEAGELVALFGPSGSGKSTLLLLAAGLLRADGGSVRFQGREMREISRREALEYRRTSLGFVFQSFNLAAGLTAEENAAIPLLLSGVDHRRAHARAREALSQVGLSHRTSHTPNALSGGEQQRVAIARALICEPRLVLADEPTGNLDSETSESVMELLSDLSKQRGAAIVLVTHDERAARHADRVLSIRDGRLADDAPAAAESPDSPTAPAAGLRTAAAPDSQAAAAASEARP